MLSEYVGREVLPQASVEELGLHVADGPVDGRRFRVVGEVVEPGRVGDPVEPLAGT